MAPRSRTALAAHRLLLRTARAPFGRLWSGAYERLARAWAAYLVRGDERPATYARGSLAGAGVIPGLSDIDVAVVVERRAPAVERWQALRRRLPAADLLLDYPMVFEPEDLRRATRASVLTCQGTAYSGARCTQDTVRLLERPGLYGATHGWRLMSGPDRLPAPAARDAGECRIAAWLELVAWWQWAVPACVDPRGPRTASLCVKLAAESARIWLFLARGERSGRLAALRRAIELLPEEEEPLRTALALSDSLTRSPAPPLGPVVSLFARMSARIAALLAAEAAQTACTEVRLAGVPDGGPLPLCDWRALVQPTGREDSFALEPGDLGSPADLGAAADLDARGPLPALRSGDLLVFAAHRNRTRLRAVACPVTDPVSFALAAGRRSAAFSGLPGWSAEDTARRAVAEHRPVLTATETGRRARQRVVGAARAALLAETLATGDPVLALTLAETERLLADRLPEPGATVGELRAAVARMPAYRGVSAALAARG